jgi:hypothetical protein
MLRRDFLALIGGTAAYSLTRRLSALAQPAADAPYAVFVPDFLAPYIPAERTTALSAVIPVLFETYAKWLPRLDVPPQVIVLNTIQKTLMVHGHEVITPDLLGDEALTLYEAQYLLVTKRFGSVATPHRGKDLDLFGQYVYLKQHPQAGYNTPHHLLLEEMLHAQQDATVMRWIIESESHDPVTCMHSQLKGISELGAHVLTDEMAGGADYVFVMADGTHCETAADALTRLSETLGADETELLGAITHDVDTYAALDAAAIAQHNQHIWEMVTTWRYTRDAEGKATGIAPAFQPY